MTGPKRIGGNGGASVRFRFDGVEYRARPGDTLAAALLANGVGLVARSFKYHRPRGIMGAGVEEPNALLTVGEGGRIEPNTRATDVFVYEGLVASSQNRWPSVSFDVGAVNGLMARFIAAGFYYKTFFGPPARWMFYERFIRRAAGLGPAPTKSDPDRYEHRSAFCDLLVVGGGASGIAAASEAVSAGKRVILVEQDSQLSAFAPVGARILTRTTASGLWDHGFVTCAQRLVEPGQLPETGQPAQRLWQIRATQIILATGAIERPLTFAGNDRPGVMLSTAVRRYVERYAVLPGQRVVVATNNDDAYTTADALARVGGEIVAILDSRAQTPESRFPTFTNARPVATKGARHHLSSVIAEIDGAPRTFGADLLAMSGGFTPTLHLHNQIGGKLDWRADLQAFVPGVTFQPVTTIGAAAGNIPTIAPDRCDLPNPKQCFVDFQNDVTAADIDLAWREGYRSVEHLKRYTTLGMATDQGKTGNMTALVRLAHVGEIDIPEAGLTRFRPPYTPLTLGTLAGPDGGGHFAPRRRIALYDRHRAANPLWQQLGLWDRPRAYPLRGETLHTAALREARAVRTSAGIVDVSTLAKFAVAGPDAAAFLEIACATGVTKLAVGRGRYTFMLREDGMILDDGTVWRLAETQYLLTSSTGGADRMESHLSYIRNVLAPDLRVSIIAQQEHYAGIALAGPKAPAILTELIGENPPAHMGLVHATLADVPVLILAASYSGERAFEVYAPGFDVASVWDVLDAAVRAEGGCRYGLEALEFLRIEKGHVVIGAEADGRTTPRDLRLEKMVRKTGGFVGAAGLSRPALSEQGRLELVGLTSPNPIPEGAMLIARDGAAVEGHVTSAARSVMGDEYIALALLNNGRSRSGGTMLASSPTRGQSAQCSIGDPLFYDPEGARYRD